MFFLYYPEEDNVLGHETSLTKTNIEEIRDVIANSLCLCHIINSLLTELVQSVQEDTAGFVLFRLFVALACGSVQKSEKRTRPCSFLLYGPLAQSITYISV